MTTDRQAALTDEQQLAALIASELTPYVQAAFGSWDVDARVSSVVDDLATRSLSAVFAAGWVSSSRLALALDRQREAIAQRIEAARLDWARDGQQERLAGENHYRGAVNTGLNEAAKLAREHSE